MARYPAARPDVVQANALDVVDEVRRYARKDGINDGAASVGQQATAADVDRDVLLEQLGKAIEELQEVHNRLQQQEGQPGDA